MQCGLLNSLCLFQFSVILVQYLVRLGLHQLYNTCRVAALLTFENCLLERSVCRGNEVAAASYLTIYSIYSCTGPQFFLRGAQAVIASYIPKSFPWTYTASMARFQDLSTELVLGILEEVLPEDIESISLASKHIYQLAIPRLEEHRSLQKQYTNFKNMVKNESMQWHDPGGLLANLFCNIMSDARIGHYVKKIDLKLWNFEKKDGWNPDEVFEKQTPTKKTRLQRDSKTNMEIIEEAIRDIEIIPTEEVDDWLHQIRLGNEDPLVALLFLRAPKLQTLRFVAPYGLRESSYLLKTVQRIAGQGSAVNPYPSHFKNVEIDFVEDWESLDFVKAFMSLPSLASITTDNLFIDGRTYEANSAILSEPSNVMEVSFRNGYIPEDAVSELVRGMRNLKTFAYSFTHLWRDERYTPSFLCLDLLNSLEATASHTLESLKLSARVLDLEIGEIAPLREFSALREVDIRTISCFAVGDSANPRLVSVLPDSIEKLAIRWHKDSFIKWREAVLDLVRASKTQLPRLRKLHMEFGDIEESDALWECFASEETAQLNKMLSFKIQGPHAGGEFPAWVDNVCTCGQDCFRT